MWDYTCDDTYLEVLENQGGVTDYREQQKYKILLFDWFSDTWRNLAGRVFFSFLMTLVSGSWNKPRTRDQLAFYSSV